MKVNITFRQLAPTEALKDYVEQRLSRLSKYVKRPMEAHVVLSVEKFRHTADIALSADGIIIVGEIWTEDMYSAIDIAIDKIERQLKKYKEKIRRHKPTSGEQYIQQKAEIKAREEIEEVEEVEESVEEEAYSVIKSQRIAAKPMSIEEAAMQLDLEAREFLVFTNARTRDVNVIYRRTDGDLGLFEPER